MRCAAACCLYPNAKHEDGIHKERRRLANNLEGGTQAEKQRLARALAFRQCDYVPAGGPALALLSAVHVR